MSEGTCKTCPWFAPGRSGRVYREESNRWVGADAAVTKGQCRLNPPELSSWPTTWDDMWCGRHPYRQTEVPHE